MIDTRYEGMLPTDPEVREEELPLRVAPGWEEDLARADQACRIIDRHLDFEARGRVLHNRHDFRAEHLCPEQRVQMVSDVYTYAG